MAVLSLMLNRFAAARADARVIVEIQSRARVQTRTQLVVGRLVDPEEVEVGPHADASIRAGAEPVRIE